MVSFPNCKINLGLHVTGKRGDGFHNLETVFYPIDFNDVLEIIPGGTDSSAVDFSCSGIPLDIEPGNNICIQAYDLIKSNHPQLPPVKMHLHKSVPAGAGLGGGSADGAFTLLSLDEQFHLGLSPAQLTEYALQLGSDCPFYVINKPVLATGRGETMKRIDLELSAYKLILVNPGVHINTGWAFLQLAPFVERPSIHKIISQPLETWKEQLVNDFEAPMINRYPQFGKIRDELFDAGAIYAAMSGSGSTFFGIFPRAAKPLLKSFPENFFVKEVDFL